MQDYDGELGAIVILRNLIYQILAKALYPYYMLKEIDEQPTVMSKLIQAYTDDNDQVVVDPAIINAVQRG